MESAYRKLLKNPRQSASLISILFFGWTIPIFKQSYRDDALDSNDAFEPLVLDQSDRLGDRLEKENSEVSRDNAIIYGVALFAFNVFSRVDFMHFYFNSFYYSMRIRIALSSLIYRKILRLSQSALSKTSSGKLVNLLSNDIQRFGSLSAHMLWISPITSIIATYILWTEVRWAAIIGIATLFIFMPMQSYAGKLVAKIRFKTALRTDER
ncbi:probable multidrug resistance-associated protein lethal(2)03659, partial [Contarinia nasturtii]|uniref:probable multidrug resistance-associated protein lethal(2)03659 n=1 Tax=Contarinia nasturtii TaxID=265458 RepID=UPI0012D4B8BC